MFAKIFHVAPTSRVAKSFVLVGAMVGLLVFTIEGRAPSAAETSKLLPAPYADVPAKGGPQSIILAGGCFWGIQGVFQHIDGVISATSGYAGGSAETATYEQTETGRTGHAEAVRVVFDPERITYGNLLRIFFSVAHDPTQVNRQGPDVGPQYRSAIFPIGDEQADIARSYVRQLDSEKAFLTKLATTVEPGKKFYEAERYHQDYMHNNPSQPYVLIHERPKIESLKQLFPELYRDQPRLVASQR